MSTEQPRDETTTTTSPPVPTTEGGDVVVPRLYDHLAYLSTFFLLVSFVFYPASSGAERYIARVGAESFHTGWVSAVFLTPMFCCGAGTIGIVGLAVRWQGHYRWLVDRLLALGLMASLAGFAGVIFGQFAWGQHPHWLVMERVGAALSAVYACAFLLGIVIASVKLRQAESRMLAEKRLKSEADPPTIPEVVRVSSPHESMAPLGRRLSQGSQ